jgi:hypothetical protein
LVTEFGPLAAPGVLPDVLPPAPMPVVPDPLPIEDPAVPLPDTPAEPPADPPAPAPACANASELDSAHVVANVAANAIALSFIVNSSLLREINGRRRPMFRAFTQKRAVLLTGEGALDGLIGRLSDLGQWFDPLPGTSKWATTV